MALDESITHVLRGYGPLFNLADNDLFEVGRSIPIPIFDENTLTKLCSVTSENLQDLPALLELEAPIYLVGDLHGNIFDLIRILNLAQLPPKSSFLFLGDYVDRGQYSVEVITLLFALFCAFPRHIFLLRGNHEFEDMNTVYGFQNEVLEHYGDLKLYRKINDTFAWLPLAAVIGKKIFCVHGGLSPALKNLDQIIKVKRPMRIIDTTLVSDLVWSDPSSDVQLYSPSTRGLGTTFGNQAIQEFLSAFHLKKIVRAHQCVQQGIARFGDNALMTVFSCSNYADASENRCGLLFVTVKEEIEIFSLPPIEQIDRSIVVMRKADKTKTMNPSPNDMIRSKSLTIYKKAAQKTTVDRRIAMKFFKNGSSQSLLIPKIQKPIDRPMMLLPRPKPKLD